MIFEKMVGREGFEPSTIGLKDSRLVYQVFINQSIMVFVHLKLCPKSPVNTGKLQVVGHKLGTPENRTSIFEIRFSVYSVEKHLFIKYLAFPRERGSIKTIC